VAIVTQQHKEQVMKKIIWMLLLVPLTGCFHHTAKENVNTKTDASSIDLVEAMRQGKRPAKSPSELQH